MPKKILQLINKEFKNINQAAILLGSFAFLAQFLGLIRDRSLAGFLGPGQELDIYYASFRVPDFLFVSVASIFAVTAILPMLTKKIGDGNDGELNNTSLEAQKFFSDVFTVFLIAIILCSLLAFILMPFLAKLVAPGFSSEALAKVVNLSRLMLVSPVLLGLSNLFGSVTQLFRNFFVFALSPFFYNLGLIIGVVLLYPLLGLKGLGLGVILAAFLHFVPNMPVAARHHFLPKLSVKIGWQEIKNLVKISLPRTLGLALYSITFLFIVAIASTVGEGSISILNLSFNIAFVPITIVGLSYSVAAFPTLSRFFSAKDIKSYLAQIGAAARQIIFWSLPITFLFIVLRAQIVRVVLGTNNFSWDDTRLAAAMLALFAVAVVAQSLNTLLVRAFYAGGRTYRPLIVNLCSLFVVVGLAKLFIYLFSAVPEIKIFLETLLRVSDIRGTDIMAIGLAYSIGIILNFFLLWFFFKQDFKISFGHDFILRTFWQSLVASFLTGVAAYQFLGVFAGAFDINTFWGIFLQGFLSGLLGIMVGVVVLRALRNREIDEIWEAVRTKFWKAKVPPPSQTGL